MTALATGLELQDIIDKSSDRYKKKANDLQEILSNYFKGAVFLCPAITLDKPHWLVLLILEYLVVPVIPKSEIPPFITRPPLDLAFIFNEPFIPYSKKDNYKSDPPGMTYDPITRFGTGFSILRLTEFVQRRITEIKFPFLIFHDPLDQVCRFAGSKELFEKSSTPSNKKQLIQVPGGLHGLIPNKTGWVLNQSIQWLRDNILSNP